MTIAWLGWAATAVQATSYFFPKISTLTKLQVAAACIWIVYGIKIGAVPVIGANLIVTGAALFSTLRNRYPKLEEETAQIVRSGDPK